MSDIIVDYGSLPEDVREKLAELELELSEGTFLQGYSIRNLGTAAMNDEGSIIRC